MGVTRMLSASVLTMALGLTACLGSDGDSPSRGRAQAPESTDAPRTTSKHSLGEIRFSSEVVEPGQSLQLRFPKDALRGVAFTLDRRVGSAWVQEFWLMSDRGGSRPFAARVGEPFGWEDIGISGADPDTVVMPADAVPGRYRICTANTRPDMCGVFESR